MPISDFLDMLTETVEYSAMIGRTDYGEVLYGTPVMYPARVVRKATKAKAADGSEILTQGFVRMGVFVDAKPDDRITLPDNSTPPVVLVEKWVDEAGDRYVKIHFG